TGLGVIGAFILLLLAGAFCFWPIAGRSAEEWIPIAGRHVARRIRGQHQFRSSAPVAGATWGRDGTESATPVAPDVARAVSVLRAPLRGDIVGVLKDRQARTYTAALAVKVASFGLLDQAEQEARQAGWGAVIAGLAREGSPIARVQWIERTVPA